MSTPADNLGRFDNQGRPPPRRPLRYLRKSVIVRNWHDWYCAEYGEPPPLKWLSAECGMSKSTVHDICVRCELPLSQSRPRRPKPEPLNLSE